MPSVAGIFRTVSGIMGDPCMIALAAMALQARRHSSLVS
jgi:hypothetical protein